MAIKEPTSLAGQALADSALLQKIDKLFECNVGDYVDLPQLVVVGDQSSGKSSVLEGLTKVNFPRDSGLCTRFATKITFRRDLSVPQREISASIVPSAQVDEDERHKLQAWKAADLQSLSPQEFSKMMHEVHEQMGISTQDGDKKPTFSNHVLQIDIRGPEESHLSVIDVPGIFKNTASGRTTKEDIALVRNMALEYMRKSRSIMLAVVPGNVDIATQEIIELTHDEDPEELRTLKILTKPDLVDKGAEHKIVELINDGNAQGQLGWILVRNLSQQDMNDGNVDRDNAEAAFRQSLPWSQVPLENYGIKALKVRLQELLTANVRRQFSKVRDEITKKLQETKEALDSLGDQRDTPERQRRILLEMAAAFQDITVHAITTNYGAHKIFDSDEHTRLATLIATRNSEFSADVAVAGHTYDFGSPFKDKLPHVLPYKENTKQSRKHIRDLEDNDIREILVESQPVQLPHKYGILPWVKEVYEGGRGFEIGTFNHNILSTLMKKQTVNWPTIAWGYISDIISYVHLFIQTVIRKICKNSQICANILSMLREGLLKNYSRAVSMVDFLLDIEREGTLVTLNHYLNDNLEKCRQKRLLEQVSPKSLDDCSHGRVVRLADVATQHHMSNVDHTVQDIHDILESYYKVARKRFVDNVCMQAVDHYLISGPETPMKLFSSTWISDLSNEELDDIAGEDMGSKRKRRQLKKKIKDLEAGKKVVLG
ncbi:unnamed protein product [Penicillium olsonii]|nr:unnamed protein product [Penicillium olsonii]